MDNCLIKDIWNIVNEYVDNKPYNAVVKQISSYYRIFRIDNMDKSWHWHKNVNVGSKLLDYIRVYELIWMDKNESQFGWVGK